MRYILLLLLCVAFLLGSTSCAPKFVGPTVPSGYFFTLVASNSIIRNTSAEVIVQVRDAQGRPVDGVSVSFRTDASWQQSASLSPSHTITRAGQARSVFQASVTGIVPLTVQVEDATQTVDIAVSARISTSP
jgi:hypothetical protein